MLLFMIRLIIRTVINSNELLMITTLLITIMIIIMIIMMMLMMIIMITIIIMITVALDKSRRRIWVVWYFLFEFINFRPGRDFINGRGLLIQGGD